MSSVITSREAHIVEKCAGKKVLHVGACDFPFTEEKFHQGTLLHSAIRESAELTVGLDNNAVGVALARTLGLDDILCGAIEDVDAHSIGFVPDLIVFGEIIEHLPNPGVALEQLNLLMNAGCNDCELIVTTPNAFCYKGFINALRGVETTHPDHMMYFTEATLTRLLQTSGFDKFTIKFAFPDRGRLPIRRRFYRWLVSRFFPRLAETLVANIYVE